jgi:putative exosortase-associated protein (TIGR04073 family)
MATYPSKAGHTLLRGTANTLLGWTELIRRPAQEVKAGGNVFTGIAHGVGSSVTRTLSGAAEVLTFWTPKIQHSYVHFAHDCPICANK